VKVLLDECVDWRLGREIAAHDVKTARQMGWTTIRNGKLLALASEQFDVFVTVDRNLSFQQNMVSYTIAVVVLRARDQPARRSQAAPAEPPVRHRVRAAEHCRNHRRRLIPAQFRGLASLQPHVAGDYEASRKSRKIGGQIVADAMIDPDVEYDALILGDTGISVDHRPLDLDRAADCIDDARKFHQHPVAGGFDDAAAMLADLRIDELAAMRPKALERALLVRSHQPRIARDIGGEDRRKPAHFGRGCRLARPSIPVGNTALDEYPPVGHLSAPLL
jgi:hypothetical protein